ncbi:hypothetical protein PVAP13_1NG226357 [Panicum virgatum]|uniref:Uncharacterized protein n=1 Tax=Panicum virgatum TaxID=38727 RepID=A0A8T0WQT3_PANVG|nr:hypothetical protein PVAP13_1NG226357 [Panicum virgatum]
MGLLGMTDTTLRNYRTWSSSSSTATAWACSSPPTEDGYSGVEVRVTPMRTDAGRRPRRRAAASGDAQRRRWATACVEKMKFGIDSIIVALFVFFLFSSMILGLKLCE